MRKAFLTCILALVMGLVFKAKAQNFEFSNLKIPQVLDVQTPDPINKPNTKRFVLNMEFDLKYNSQDKVVNVHLFLENDYSAISARKALVSCTDRSAANIPTREELGINISETGTSILDLAIDNTDGHKAQGVTVPVYLLQSYVNDQNVALTSTVNSSPVTVTKTLTTANTDHFVINNLVLFVNNYTSNTIPIRAIVWSSNGNAGNVQNATCNSPFYFNDPVVTGSISCGLPRQFMFNAKFAAPISEPVNYEAILDLNGNGAIDSGEPIVNSGYIPSNNSSNEYTSAVLPFAPSYATSQEYEGKKLMIVIRGGSYVTGEVPQTLDIETCSVLPVEFKSFTAIRNKQKNEQVVLKWEVATEQNNKGFYVQRKTTGEWQNITFVPTKASNGNSSTTLTYNYVDQNTTKNVTQYRLLQVDFDNKNSFSEVRSVLGADKSMSMLLYPNPSPDGKVNLVFNDQNSVKEVVVCDMTGRVVKYYPQVLNNNLTIEGLKGGIYTIKITDRSTSVSSVEKVIVK